MERVIHLLHFILITEITGPVQQAKRDQDLSTRGTNTKTEATNKEKEKSKEEVKKDKDDADSEADTELGKEHKKYADAITGAVPNIKILFNSKKSTLEKTQVYFELILI